MQLYSISTTIDCTIDLNENVMDYLDEDDDIPTYEDLDKQYKLFCTRKSQIEESTLPSEVNKEQFYDCNEKEIEEFFDTNQYHDICHVTKKKPSKSFHLKINHIALEKGQTHQYLSQNEVDTWLQSLSYDELVGYHTAFEPLVFAISTIDKLQNLENLQPKLAWKPL